MRYYASIMCVLCIYIRIYVKNWVLFGRHRLCLLWDFGAWIKAFKNEIGLFRKLSLCLGVHEHCRCGGGGGVQELRIILYGITSAFVWVCGAHRPSAVGFFATSLSHQFTILPRKISRLCRDVTLVHYANACFPCPHPSPLQHFSLPLYCFWFIWLILVYSKYNLNLNYFYHYRE